jgi:methanol--5-hydroxybenzimidazolylcobamide Co-methyltransferase
MSTTYCDLAIANADDLVFGRAPKPVRCGFDLEIGAGAVFPEVNFTLPAIEISYATWPQVVAHYEEMARNILKRAVSLRVPGIVLEFELLPPMTEHPEWGAEITALFRRHLAEAHAKSGLRSALRVTPTDIRDQGKPPLLRTGEAWENLQRSFELCIAAGGYPACVRRRVGKRSRAATLRAASRIRQCNSRIRRCCPKSWQRW